MDSAQPKWHNGAITRFLQNAAFVLTLLLVTRSALADADPRSHWAFQPVHKPAVPTAQNSQWVKTPVDSFILQKLEEHHWSPASPVSKTVLIRRVYFDVTGLPPDPEVIQRFLDDKSPGAYEKVVENYSTATNMQNAGRNIGWMSSVMPKRKVTNTIGIFLTPGVIAITSSIL
jgi:hypothetical protein